MAPQKKKRVYKKKRGGGENKTKYNNTYGLLPSNLQQIDIGETFERQRREYHLITKPGQDNFASTFFEALSYKLIDWALNDENALTLTDFYYQNNISRPTFEVWLKKHKNLREAFEFARGIIGNRREKGALKRELDASTHKISWAMYSPEYKALMEWSSKLGMTEEQKNTLYKIYMPDLTGKFKELPKEETHEEK